MDKKQTTHPVQTGSQPEPPHAPAHHNHGGHGMYSVAVNRVSRKGHNHRRAHG